MVETKVFNFVENVVSKDEITVSFLNELVGGDFHSLSSGQSIIQLLGGYSEYEMEILVGVEFKCHLRIKNDGITIGLLEMSPIDSVIYEKGIISQLQKIDYVVIPSIEMGVETISYQVGTKEVFFVFDMESEILTSICIHF